jgi:hypothetical protein
MFGEQCLAAVRLRLGRSHNREEKDECCRTKTHSYALNLTVEIDLDDTEEALPGQELSAKPSSHDRARLAFVAILHRSIDD